VFGGPDTKYGEELCAWIVSKAGAALDEEEVRRFSQDRITTRFRATFASSRVFRQP
jgi:fatty-acyl-CoA synthase